MTARIVGIAACLIALASLCFFSYRVGSPPVDTLREVMAKPEQVAGKEILFASDVEVVRVFPSALEVEQGGVFMQVRIPADVEQQWDNVRADITPKDFMSLRAVYREDGYLEARQLHVHKGRRLKIWISLGALLLAGVIVLDQVRREPLA